MRPKKQLHAWFAHPSIDEIVEACTQHGFAYLRRERGRTDAMDDAGIEDRGEGQLPWLFGPTIHKLPDEVLAPLSCALDQWLTDIGGRFLENEPYRHFEVNIGPNRCSLKFRHEDIAFLAASERRDLADGSCPWLTVSWFSFDRPVPSTATEDAIAGSRQRFLSEYLKNQPIVSAFRTYCVDASYENADTLDCVRIANSTLKESLL